MKQKHMISLQERLDQKFNTESYETNESLILLSAIALLGLVAAPMLNSPAGKAVSNGLGGIFSGIGSLFGMIHNKNDKDKKDPKKKEKAEKVEKATNEVAKSMVKNDGTMPNWDEISAGDFIKGKSKSLVDKTMAKLGYKPMSKEELASTIDKTKTEMAAATDAEKELNEKRGAEVTAQAHVDKINDSIKEAKEKGEDTKELESQLEEANKKLSETKESTKSAQEKVDKENAEKEAEKKKDEPEKKDGESKDGEKKDDSEKKDEPEEEDVKGSDGQTWIRRKKMVGDGYTYCLKSDRTVTKSEDEWRKEQSKKNESLADFLCRELNY